MSPPGTPWSIPSDSDRVPLNLIFIYNLIWNPGFWHPYFEICVLNNIYDIVNMGFAKYRFIFLRIRFINQNTDWKTTTSDEVLVNWVGSFLNPLYCIFIDGIIPDTGRGDVDSLGSGCDSETVHTHWSFRILYSTRVLYCKYSYGYTCTHWLYMYLFTLIIDCKIWSTIHGS